MNFAKTFFAALLAFFVGNVLFGILSLMMLIFLAFAVGSASDGVVMPKIKAKSVLMIDLKAGITDAPPTSPFTMDNFGSIHVNNSATILQAVAAIEHAIGDANIRGAYINIGYRGSVSLSNIEELRKSLKKFRESGKFVISYADNYSQTGYYLSSIADRVYLNPEGGIDWRGMASGVMFYKGLLDKFDIRAEIIRHGSFKSAVEPFMLDRMSPENREQLNTMLSTIWEAILSDISESRGIEKQVLSAYASDLTIDSPEIAYDSGMIDGILYEDQVLDMIGRLASGRESLQVSEISDEESVEMAEDGLVWQDESITALEDDEELSIHENLTDSVVYIAADDITMATDGNKQHEDLGIESSSSLKPNIVSLSDYIKSIKSGSSGRNAKNKVAIVYVDGDIINGESKSGSVGGKTIAEKLKKARQDKNTKAVVLRVNSPGGSIIGAEVIWRELDMTRLEKPVVVSMGGMAASGGYYIACPADVILANRTTITGSIGVFSILFDVGEALRKNLGITVDVAKTNPSADIGSGYRPLSAFERRYFQKQVDDAYTTFVGHVSEGRNMTVEAVDAVGNGRVWSGINAAANGLVDGYGGIIEAIELAAQRGGAGHDYTVWEVVDSPDNISAIMRSLLASEEMRMSNALGESLRHYNTVINMLNTPNDIQARVPYDIEIF